MTKAMCAGSIDGPVVAAAIAVISAVRSSRVRDGPGVQDVRRDVDEFLDPLAAQLATVHHDQTMRTVGREVGPQERLVLWPSPAYLFRLCLLWGFALALVPGGILAKMVTSNDWPRSWLTGAAVAWGFLVLAAGSRTRLIADGQHVIVRNGLITHRLRAEEIWVVDLDRDVLFVEQGNATCVRLRSSTAKPVRVLATTRANSQRCERDAQRLAAFLGLSFERKQPEKPPSLVVRWRAWRNRRSTNSTSPSGLEQPQVQLPEGRLNVRVAQFRVRRRGGYDTRDVDEFLDRLAAAEPNAITPREIRQANFREARRGGYDTRDVDEFLDRLATQLATVHQDSNESRDSAESDPWVPGTPPLPRRRWPVVVGIIVVAGVVWAAVAAAVVLITSDDEDEVATPSGNDAEDGGATDDARALNGVYHLEWSLEELVAAGVPEQVVHEFDMAGAFTWSLDNGELEFAGEFPDGRSVKCGGTYAIRAEVANLEWQAPCPLWRFTASWELTDGELVFSDTRLDGEPNPVLDVWLAGKSWTKID
jgi:DivIVA domain-containing protein